jgi:hypothetical protein
MILKGTDSTLAMVVHICNSSSQEAKVGESTVQGQPGLHTVELFFFSIL